MNNDYLELKKKQLKKIRKIMMIVTILSFFLNLAQPVYAADDPLSVINNLSDFIFSLTRAIGTIILIIGMVQVGMSYQSHDPSQRTSGIFTLVGGIIIAFSKEIINTILK